MKFRKFWPVFTLFLLGSALLFSPFPGAAQERPELKNNSCLEKECLAPEDCLQNQSRVQKCVSLQVSEMNRERVQNCEKTQERFKEKEGSQKPEGDRPGVSQRGVKTVINYPPEMIEELRDQGLGYGEIAIIQLLQERSGKTIEEILSLFREGKGWGEIASILGVDFSGIGEFVSQGKASPKQEKNGSMK